MSDPAASVLFATACPKCQRKAVRFIEGTRTARCGWCAAVFPIELRVKLDGPEFTHVRQDVDPYL